MDLLGNIIGFLVAGAIIYGVFLVSTLTAVILIGIGADWYGIAGGTIFITGVLCVASYNIIEVHKQLDSLRSALDYIENDRDVRYKKHIYELEVEINKLRDML